MPDNTHLIERSLELKRALAEFARKPRFRRALGQAFKAHFGERVMVSTGEMANFHDHFFLQYRLSDGRTVVDHFVEAHPELPEDERAMLLAWQEVVEEIFEVQGRDREALIVVGLIDELTYRVRSNMGPSVFSKMPRGSFIITRLVPVGDEWLLSGVASLSSASHRDEVYRIAAEAASTQRRVLFRNPEKLKQAWDLQRKERLDFIAFFGSDLVVLPGAKLAERMRAYRHFLMHELRDAEGKSAADRAKEAYGFVPKTPDLDLPEDLRRAKTVGVIYDEVEGLHFLANFGLVGETFSNPELASDKRHRDAVLGYLKEPTIPPLALRRLAERDPKRASLVFQSVLKKPGFSWERDGEALLRRYKASYFERPTLPSVTPISGKLARAHVSGSNSRKA